MADAAPAQESAPQEAAEAKAEAEIGRVHV